MEKGRDAEALVALAIQATVRVEVVRIHRGHLQDVRHDVVVGQAHALGQACRAGAVD